MEVETISTQKAIKKLLVIDDNPLDNLICQKLINDSKIQCVYMIIDSSLDAYDYLFDEISIEDFPNVIFLDLNMPIYSGFEFLEKIDKMILENDIKSKVYVLTSSSNPKDLKRALSYKAVKDYITKPLNSEVLTRVLKNM